MPCVPRGCGSCAWCRRFDGCPRCESRQEAHQPASSAARLFDLDVDQRPGGVPSEFDEAVSRLDEEWP